MRLAVSLCVSATLALLAAAPIAACAQDYGQGDPSYSQDGSVLQSGPPGYVLQGLPPDQPYADQGYAAYPPPPPIYPPPLSYSPPQVYVQPPSYPSPYPGGGYPGYGNPGQDYGRYQRPDDSGRWGRPPPDAHAAQQEQYNRSVVQLQQQHNQGVVALQQQFNQGRLTREQLNAGYGQLERQLNNGITQQQNSLPR